MSRVMPVLNQLYAGKKITLEFDSAEARENFRTDLYKIKRTQDAAIEAIEDEFKPKVLKCILSPLFANKAEMKIWLEDKKPSEFKILLVEDVITEGENGNGAGK